jgi:GNAT superfamily N-acetyltransferase
MSIKRKSKRASLVIHILTPGECSAEDLQSFARLVRQGDQVSSAGLESRIAAAAWLGFAWSGRRLAGVAALKIPRSEYRRKVFSAAQASTPARSFQLEFGWAVVLPQFRGLGIAKSLLRELLAKNAATGTFATTNEDNRFMQKILQDSGFQLTGQPFRSRRKQTSNYLWVRSGFSDS